MVELHRQNLKYNKKKYKEVKKILRTRINKNMPIEHIGSTILPNMYGKNIIMLCTFTIIRYIIYV